MSVSVESWKTCPNPFNEKNENVCTICYSSDPAQTVSHAPKNSSKAEHVFHKTCIKTWVDSGEENNKCPLCREEVSPGNTKGKYQDLADNFDRWNRSESTKLDLAVSAAAAAAAGALAAVATATVVAESLGFGGLVPGSGELVAAAGGLLGLASVAGSQSLRPMLQNRELGRIELFTGTVAVAAGVAAATGVVISGVAAAATAATAAGEGVAALAGVAGVLGVGIGAGAVITGGAAARVAAEGARGIKRYLLSVLRR